MRKTKDSDTAEEGSMLLADHDLHRDRPSATSTFAPNRTTAAFLLVFILVAVSETRSLVAVRIVLARLDRVERSVRTGIADNARALVCEPSERESLPNVQDMLTVYFVLQQRVTRSISGRPVRRRQRLLHRQ